MPVGNSPTRDRTRVARTEVQPANHCATELLCWIVQPSLDTVVVGNNVQVMNRKKYAIALRIAIIKQLQTYWNAQQYSVISKLHDSVPAPHTTSRDCIPWYLPDLTISKLLTFPIPFLVAPTHPYRTLSNPILLLPTIPSPIPNTPHPILCTNGHTSSLNHISSYAIDIGPK